MSAHKKLQLKVRAGSVRSSVGVVSNEEVQRILTLLDGVTVEARVYSSTNMCFHVTESMMRDAWKNLDESEHFWINEKNVEKIIERFTVPNEWDNTLACPLPNLHCESTPAEIDVMLENAGMWLLGQHAL